MEQKTMNIYEKGFKLIGLGMEILATWDSFEFDGEEDFPGDEIGGGIEMIGWEYLSPSPVAIFDDNHRFYHHMFDGVVFDGTMNQQVLKELDYRDLLRDKENPMNYVTDLELTKQLIEYRIMLDKYHLTKEKHPEWIETLDEVLLAKLNF